MPEILAPVGNKEMLIAAVRSGANAVYLGSKNFNARRNSENFSDEELALAVKYCHTHGVKVYHTLNTLFKDREKEDIINELKRILERNEDALILQDLGLINIVKSVCPDMPLHASTQLSIHTLSGVKYMEKLGFKRVVLARELSKKEIKYIRDNSNIELEIFVHGALCMCVSGQCYFSSMLGARSGNRGLCAQPCRLNFSAEGGTGKDLSLKDNSLLTHLPEMAEMGIDSFKIEGRMKRPEYVAASVSAAKKSLKNSLLESEIDTLKSIFSRQGFTDGYYCSFLGRNMFGTRRYEDVVAVENKTLKRIANEYRNENPLIPCTVTAEIGLNKLPFLKIEALEKQFSQYGTQKPEKAINRAVTQEEIVDRLSKLGGTQFYAQKVDVKCENGLSVRASEINELRRKCIEGLENELAEDKKYTLCIEKIPKIYNKVHINNKLYIRVASLSQIENVDLSGVNKIIVPLNQVKKATEIIDKSKIVAEAPRVMFSAESKVTEMMKTAKESGISEIACGNVGSVRLAEKHEFKVFPFLGMNVFNSYALNLLNCEDNLLSFELSLSDIENIKTDKNIGAIVYGHMPLMITRNCPIKNAKTCEECKATSHLRDRKGEKLEVRCAFTGSEIFNPRPVYMLDRLNEIKNTDFSLLYFTYENADEVQNIMKKYYSGEKSDEDFTRGLYYKGVL